MILAVIVSRSTRKRKQNSSRDCSENAPSSWKVHAPFTSPAGQVIALSREETIGARSERSKCDGSSSRPRKERERERERESSPTLLALLSRDSTRSSLRSRYRKISMPQRMLLISSVTRVTAIDRSSSDRACIERNRARANRSNERLPESANGSHPREARNRRG